MPLQLYSQKLDSIYVNLDSIEVSALRTTLVSHEAPVSLNLWSRNLSSLNLDASESLTAVAGNLPGLWVNDRQNYALGERMSIRGMGWRADFGVRGIQVVLNEIPLTVADGQTMMDVIDPAFVRQAELIRGPSSAYWGNSSGGVLSLKTTPVNQSDQPTVRLRSFTGSYGLRKAEAEMAVNTADHQMSAYTSYLKTEGFRDYSAANVWRTGINGTLNLTSRSNLSYHGAGIIMPKAQHPGSLTEDQAQNSPQMAVPAYTDTAAQAGKTIGQGQTGLSYQLDTEQGRITLSGYGIYRDLENPLPFGIITLNRLATGIRGTYENEWDAVNIQVGMEAKLQHDDRIEFENRGRATKGDIQVNQVEQVWNQALFTTATYALEPLQVLAGLRYDRLIFSTEAPTPDQTGKRIFQAVNPALGLSLKISNHTLFGNISTSFEAPTSTELVNRPDGGNGFNPTLAPERTAGLELGARGYFNGSLSYDIAAYRLWIKDMLFPYQEEAFGPTFYENLGESRHTGIEGQFSWRINSVWELTTAGEIIEAIFQKGITETGEQMLEGMSVPGIPKYRSRSKLNWSTNNIAASLSYEYVSSYQVNNLNTEENDKYSLVDFKISYRKDFYDSSVEIQPFFNLNNLFNARYNSSFIPNHPGQQYFEPAPGRHWRAGVAVSF